MAFPTIPTAAASRVLTGYQADTTGTRTFPSLTGLTKNSGDLLIAICIAYQSSTTDAQFSGWTGSFNEFHDSGTGTTMAIGAAYKFSDGTETGTFAVTQAATITGHACFILLSIPGAHSSSIPEAGSRASGTSSAADPGSFDPSWAAEDILWIAVGGAGEVSTTAAWTGLASAPTSYTDYAETGLGGQDVAGAVEGAVGFRQLNATSTDVGTFGVDVANARNAALVIAVRPGGTATVTPDPVACTTAIPAVEVSVAAAPAQIASITALPAPTVIAGGAGADVTPDPVTVTAALPASAVSVGAAPAVISTSAALPAPAISVAAAPAMLASTLTLPQAGVSVAAAPAVLAAAVAAPVPAVSVAAAPGVLTVVAALPAPTVDVGGGNATVSPDVLASTVSLPGAAISIASAPAVLAAVMSFPAALVGIGVSPAVVAVVTALPAPTVLAGGDATVNAAVIAVVVALPSVVIYYGQIAVPGTAHGPLPLMPGYSGPSTTVGLAGGIT